MNDCSDLDLEAIVSFIVIHCLFFFLLKGTPLSEADFFSRLFWFSFVNVYDGVLYPRYKNQNSTSLDSSEKQISRWQENCFSFCCLLIFFSSLEQLKRVDEKKNFELFYAYLKTRFWAAIKSFPPFSSKRLDQSDWKFFYKY